MTLAIGDDGARLRAARHRRDDLVGDRRRRRPPSSCSPATTARTRSPGTTASPTPRATTPTAACGSWRSTPTTPTRHPRDSLRGDAGAGRLARTGRCPTSTTRPRTSRAPTAPRRRRTCSCSTPSGRLRYRGAPDSDYDDPGQQAAWLRDALDARAGRAEPAPAETKPVGCSIKWKRLGDYPQLGGGPPTGVQLMTGAARVPSRPDSGHAGGPVLAGAVDGMAALRRSPSPSGARAAWQTTFRARVRRPGMGGQLGGRRRASRRSGRASWRRLADARARPRDSRPRRRATATSWGCRPGFRSP